MRIRQGLLAGVGLLLWMASPALAQTIPAPPEMVSLSGPRVGFTALSDGISHTLETDYHVFINPIVSQFGWQFEKQFYSRRHDGPAALTEAVVLFGGLEQGVAIPSLTWLVGIRTQSGAEFGIGPNLTPLGTGLAFAAGKTVKFGVLNVPMNVAVVPSRSGVRLSFLTGFSMR